ncbi:unnamed protein product [Caenorhabditis nigoni]
MGNRGSINEEAVSGSSSLFRLMTNGKDIRKKFGLNCHKIDEMRFLDSRSSTARSRRKSKADSIDEYSINRR